MRRIVAMMLILCLCFGLCACGKSSKAKKADELILAIGEVSLDKETAIQNAQSCYNELTDEQKSEVANYYLLQNAQETLSKLKKVADVENSINMIGTVTIDSEPLITEALTKFNALSEDEQNLVSEECCAALVTAQIALLKIVASMHWKVDYTVDQFGDKTDNGYVIGTFSGKFSNTATSGSDLTVFVYYFPFSHSFAFRLAEYGNHIATYSKNDLINLSIKIGGEVYSVECYGMAPNGDAYFGSTNAYEDSTLRSINGSNRSAVYDLFLSTLLDHTETISCSIVIGDIDEIVLHSGGASKYTFEIDGNGFSEQLDSLNCTD